jgi:hypothetical protein
MRNVFECSVVLARVQMGLVECGEPTLQGLPHLDYKFGASCRQPKVTVSVAGRTKLLSLATSETLNKGRKSNEMKLHICQ